jgi:flavin reductase (DIM6/NTAB) family NADH-FMN oxidoreductase RutF
MSDFERLVAGLDYPLFIVTTRARGGEPDGCLIGFATQTSIEPPRFLACLSKKNRTYRAALDAEILAVHLVPDDDRDLAELFGGETGDEVDKFAQVAWRAGPGGVPVLERCESWFAGRILERLDVGDHCGFLLEPLAAEAEDGDTISFQEAKGIEPGHEP